MTGAEARKVAWSSEICGWATSSKVPLAERGHVRIFS